MRPPHLFKLAAALGISNTILPAAAAEASSANHYRHHRHHIISADQVRVGLQPRQTGSGAAAGGNMQTFPGALGGIRADAVTATGDADRPFAVGGDTFTDLASAVGRSCDEQMNSCARMANSGGAGFSVGDCNTQACEFFFL